MKNKLFRSTAAGWLLILLASNFGFSGHAMTWYVIMEPAPGFFSWRFNPSYLEIQAGDSVIWRNEDYTSSGYWPGHAAVCYSSSTVVWSSGTVYPSYESPPITFPYVATYTYVDPNFEDLDMVGILVVNPAGPAPVPATLVAPTVLLGGSFQCLVSNLVVGKTYVVQSSADLVEWTSLATNTAASTVEPFTDSSAGNLPAQFYRSWHLP